MASTNKTTNYQLSQFQNNDIPAWLTDYNGDMQNIDAGIHAAKVQADGAASGVSSLQTAMSGKQDKLTFDTTPINGSNNPVTSGGIYNALQSASVETDAVPTAGSTKPVQSGGVYTALEGKQNNLTFDDTPTQYSDNPITSGGVYSALQNISAVGRRVACTVGANQTGLNVACFAIGDLYFFILTGYVTKTTDSNPVSVSISERVTGAPSSVKALENQQLVRYSTNAIDVSKIHWRWHSSSNATVFSLVFGNSGDTSVVSQVVCVM